MLQSDNFFPPEWFEQDGVMLTWPHKSTDWAPVLPEVERTYLNIAREIIKKEKLLIVCENKEQLRGHFTEEELSAVRFCEIPSNDTWARDHGPVFTFEHGKPVINDFGFNGWGGKFEAMLDNRITGELFRLGAFNPNARYRDHSGFILEGGSIETDGAGTILTTANCLLNPNRNNELTRSQIEYRLRESLGAQQVLWLEYGKIEELKKMEQQLRGLRNVYGDAYRLVPLPMASPETGKEEKRMPATYANFLIINGAVLLPLYRVAEDREAVRIMSEIFPDREIQGIDCTTLIKQNGSLHCVTMQIPKGLLV
jgi:agmatine deiminase